MILLFDSEIGSALQGSQVTLDDGQFTSTTYLANPTPIRDGPTTLRLPPDKNGSSSISDVRLTATALSGIVAADDGGTWAGVSGVSLPFP